MSATRGLCALPENESQGVKRRRQRPPAVFESMKERTNLPAEVNAGKVSGATTTTLAASGDDT